MIKIRLSGKHRDKFALVDDEDAERVVAAGPWFFNKQGYVVANMSGPGAQRSQILLHRLVLGLVKGDRVQADHKDRNKLNCQRVNLRRATNAQNRQNLDSRRGSSRYRGVSWHTARGQWVVQGKLNRKTIHIGYYRDEQEAAEAAAAWRREHMPYSEEAAS